MHEAALVSTQRESIFAIWTQPFAEPAAHTPVSVQLEHGQKAAACDSKTISVLTYLSHASFWLCRDTVLEMMT